MTFPPRRRFRTARSLDLLTRRAMLAALLALAGCATAPAEPAKAPRVAKDGPIQHVESPILGDYDLATGHFRATPRLGTVLRTDGMVDGTPRGHGATVSARRSYNVTEINADGTMSQSYRVKTDSPNSSTITKLNKDGSSGQSVKVTEE